MCVYVRACMHVCACMRAHTGVCVCVQVCVCAFGCCFVGANELLVDVCQCCCLLLFVRLLLSRHFPCCKTWGIKNLNLNSGTCRQLSLSLQNVGVFQHLVEAARVISCC